MAENWYKAPLTFKPWKKFNLINILDEKPKIKIQFKIN